MEAMYWEEIPEREVPMKWGGDEWSSDEEEEYTTSNQRSPLMKIYRKADMTYISFEGPTISYVQFKVKLSKHVSDDEWKDAETNLDAFAHLYWRMKITTQKRVEHLTSCKERRAR
jgi:hypothetical protein